MRLYVCKGARGSRVALGGMVGDGGEGRKGIEGRGGCGSRRVRWQKPPSRYLGEGCFSRLAKWPPPPPGARTWLEGVEGSNFLHPALFIPCSFVRSLAHAASPSPFVPLPPPAVGLRHLAPSPSASRYLSPSLCPSFSLPPIVRVPSTPSSRVIHPSSSAIHPFLRHS